MKENLKMIKEKEKELNILIMVIDMKVILEMVKEKEKEFIIIIVVIDKVKAAIESDPTTRATVEVLKKKVDPE